MMQMIRMMIRMMQFAFSLLSAFDSLDCKIISENTWSARSLMARLTEHSLATKPLFRSVLIVHGSAIQDAFTVHRLSFISSAYIERRAYTKEEGHIRTAVVFVESFVANCNERSFAGGDGHPVQRNQHITLFTTANPELMIRLPEESF